MNLVGEFAFPSISTHSGRHIKIAFSGCNRAVGEGGLGMHSRVDPGIRALRGAPAIYVITYDRVSGGLP